MKLKEYLDENKVSINRIAGDTGISVGAIYDYIKGKAASMKNAKKIEIYTKGEVTLYDLKGD